MLIEVPPQVEVFPLGKSRAYHVKHFRKPKFDFLWHAHPELELTYVLRGSGVRYVGGSIQPFHDGDLCLSGSHVPHGYGAHPHCDSGAEWIVLQFSTHAWGQSFWQLPENKPVASLFKNAKRGIHFQGAAAARCGDLLKGICEESLARVSGLSRVLGLLETLADCRDVNYLNERESCQIEHPDSRLETVLRWVENNAGNEIDQAEVARMVGMSPAVFSRFFRRKTGRVFTRHVNELRLARACVSLLRGPSSINEIALESGFNNLANFNRRFLEIVGVTPRDYRASREVQGSTRH
jgi:AraC-like DNA-binding protein